jgi:signal transduction histidine kinase
MEPLHNISGLALWCDRNGVIGQISRNDTDLLEHLTVGQSLADLVDNAGKNKMQNFLQAIQEREGAFDWELNVVDGDRVTTLHFAAVRFTTEVVLIVLARTSNGVMALFDEMMRMNNEQANQLRQVIKEQTELVRTRADQDSTLYDQLSQLNNELATLQRELARKNSALQETLTQLRETQALLIHSEKMSALGQLTAGIAHEINNPLAFIIGNLQSLQVAYADMDGAYVELEKLVRDQGTEAQREAAIVIRQDADLDFILHDLDDLLSATLEGSKRIQKLVENLRNFSRLDEAARKKIDLAENVATTLAIARPYLQSRVDVSVELDLLPSIMGYPAELNQVFLNLIINAAQAIEEGGRLMIQGFQDGDNIVLRFIDTGQGITPDVLQHIFEPFFTTKPVGSGTGLGLTIAYRIITEMHHGEISVSSTPGQGSTFTIRLPLEAAL